MKRLKSLWRIIIDNSSINKFYLYIVVVSVCASCKCAMLETNMETDTFHAYEWISDYYKYNWILPDSMEQLIRFGDGFVAHYWNDSFYKRNAKQSWLSLYNNCKQHRKSFSFLRHENYVVMINYNKRWYVGLEKSICYDIQNNTLFSYRDVILDKCNTVCYNLLDSLENDKKLLGEEFRVIIEQMSLYPTCSKVVCCSYDKTSGNVILMCEPSDNNSYLLFKDIIEGFANSFVKKHAEICTFKFTIRIPILED